MRKFTLLKTSIKYLLIGLIIVSCKSNLDLMEIKLGKTNINELVNEEIDYNSFEIDGTTYKSTYSKKVLIINNTELQNQARDTTFSNYVSFAYNEKSIITEYTLAYYTLKEDSKVVYNLLKDKMGPPSFKHFANSSDKEKGNNNFDAVIWEDKESDTFYRLIYHNWEEGLRELRLTVLINSESDVKDSTYSGQPFYFWRDYINARNELGNDDFTYQEFIKKRGGGYGFYTE